MCPVYTLKIINLKKNYNFRPSSLRTAIRRAVCFISTLSDKQKDLAWRGFWSEHQHVMLRLCSFINTIYHLISGKGRANAGLPVITDDEIWIEKSCIRSRELPTNQQLNKNGQPSPTRTKNLDVSLFSHGIRLLASIKNENLMTSVIYTGGCEVHCVNSRKRGLISNQGHYHNP